MYHNVGSPSSHYSYWELPSILDFLLCIWPSVQKTVCDVSRSVVKHKDKSSERSQNRRNDLLILALYVLTAASIIDLLEGKSENDLGLLVNSPTGPKIQIQK